jgi:hypothetical protein
MRRKIIISAIVLGTLFALLMFYGLAYGRSLRLSRVMLGRSVLKQAQQQLAETGRVEPNGSWRPVEFTNDVTIGGVIYRCSVATPLAGFDDEGIFAMTTNETFIWVDKKRAPKIIPTSGYRPRLFPESF